MILSPMAVEASPITLFAPPNREMMYDDRIQTAYGNMTEKIVPANGFGGTELCPAPAFKAESGLTCNIPFSRKRLRDSSEFNPPAFCFPKSPIVNPNQQQFEFIGEDFSSQIYQQQLEINRLIDRHTEKVRMEIEEMRKRNNRRLAAAYEGIINRLLKTKEEQIFKIGQLNRSLEEKVKSITVENELWRELAQTNEATANALRNNLQQILTQIQLQHEHRLVLADNGNGDDDVVESHCGSNFEEDYRQVIGGERKVNDDESEYCKGKGEGSGRSRYGRGCRGCGKGESCVLLLPCRHLCVCSLCVASVDVCPVCGSVKTAGLMVNMS